MTLTRATVLLVLVVLGGCLGAGGGDPTPTPEPPEAAWAPGSGLNETVLAERHFAALRTAGSFTRNRTAAIAIDGEVRPDGPRPDWYRPPRHTTETVDLDDRRYHRESVTRGGERAETFISPAEEATRRKPCPTDACDWAYRHLERADPDTLVREINRFHGDRPVELLAEGLDDWAFTYAGRTALDGERVYRYTATWTFEGAVHPFAGQPEGTGTLLVTADGVVRRWEVQYTGPAEVTVGGETRTVTVTQRQVVRYDDIGEARLDRPDWVDRAAANDPPPETATAGP